MGLRDPSWSSVWWKSVLPWMVPVPKVPKYCNVWLACTSCFLPHDIYNTIHLCTLESSHDFHHRFQKLKPPNWFPVNFSLHSYVSRALQDLLSCTAGSQHAFRWWQHTSINLTNLVQHAICNYFPLSSWIFSPDYFQFNLYVGKDSTFRKDS